MYRDVHTRLALSRSNREIEFYSADLRGLVAAAEPGARENHSFVRTFAYWTGPAYGLLLDGAASDTAARASLFGDEIRAAEHGRERQRQERLAELRRRPTIR
ncbi:MAG TPA: hypothetical protein VIL35_08675 [Vicinamibacterales bacterium]